MRTFAVSMTFLVALLLGGGYVAYRWAIAPEAEHHETEQHSATQNTTSAAQTTTEESNNLAAGKVEGDEARAEATQAELSGHADQGRILYQSNCQGCHGAKAEGVVGPALAGKGQPAHWTYAQFQRAVTEGIDKNNNNLKDIMPRYKQTPLLPKKEPATDQDIADIQAYLQTL